jgi:hypothetical protein
MHAGEKKKKKVLDMRKRFVHTVCMEEINMEYNQLNKDFSRWCSIRSTEHENGRNHNYQNFLEYLALYSITLNNSAEIWNWYIV